MNIYRFAAAKWTAPTDEGEATLTLGQLLRTILLFLAFALAIALATHESRAAASDRKMPDPGSGFETL
jgi:hypothetical protein